MSNDHAPSDLRTVRDFFRYAISRFNRAELVYGHGATNAVDEAAFIVLEGLRLPIDQLEPFLDARLLPEEKERLHQLIEARVSQRKPAAYLLGKAYIDGMAFDIDERVIVPRSFIGELLAGELLAGGAQALIDDPHAVGRVLDLCTGSGCLAILAAREFPNALVDAVDLSQDALAVAAGNVAKSDYADRISLHRSDLFSALPQEAHGSYDLILTNPPYVDQAAMENLPPEFRCEPEMALAGGPDGLVLVRRILADAPRFLAPGGGLLCEIGRGRALIEDEFPHLALLWLDTEDSEGEVFWLVNDSI